MQVISLIKRSVLSQLAQLSQLLVQVTKELIKCQCAYDRFINYSTTAAVSPKTSLSRLNALQLARFKEAGLKFKLWTSEPDAAGKDNGIKRVQDEGHGRQIDLLHSNAPQQQQQQLHSGKCQSATRERDKERGGEGE